MGLLLAPSDWQPIEIDSSNYMRSSMLHRDLFQYSSSVRSVRRSRHIVKGRSKVS
ncbi:unnamed protein product [Nezara viridula]|uniref:Uncharacterized protein n=1 Tax=Nezara viridula TaxID=85310 RepID=A0A9P0H8K4_NEZVI|nr:unnamed protein product [Nezara viridula]